MVAPRTNYRANETVRGLMVEITSALVSMTEISREVTADDLQHTRLHLMAALDLAKRLLKGELKPEPVAKLNGTHHLHTVPGDVPLELQH